MPEYADIKDRRATILFGEQHLREILSLPEGIEIRGVTVSPQDLGIVRVHVMGEALEEVDPGAEAPLMKGSLESTSVQHDGRRYVRFGWAPDESGRALRFVEVADDDD